jgi:hypothetical protein
MDDFMFMAHSREVALLLRDRVDALLYRLGLQRKPKKGQWEPTQVGDHRGLTIDLLNEFRASVENVHALSKHAAALLSRATNTATSKTTSGVRWKSAIFLPRHRANTFLSPQTSQRPEYTPWMGRTSTDDTPTQTRPRMVAHSARPSQRTLNLQAHRDGVPPRRLQCLRMGSRAKRQPCLSGARFWARHQRRYSDTPMAPSTCA